MIPNNANTLFLALLLLLTPELVIATAFLRVGVDGGGDKIGILSMDGTRVVSVSAATGPTIEFGKRIQTLNQNGVSVITEILVGYKTANSDTSNGTLDFHRYMLTGNRFWGIGRWRAGVGLSLHNNGRMEVTGEAFSDEEQPLWAINESLGFAAMIDYAWSRNIQFGMRAILLNYHLSDDLGNTGLADASSVGVFFNFMLQRRE